jgi:hypothetical protein
MMEERGVCLDHSSVNRWTIRFLPLLEKVFRKHKRPVGASWRMDETYIEVKGVWKYLYRAVDVDGQARQGRSPAVLRERHEGQRCSREGNDGQERRQQGGHG